MPRRESASSALHAFDDRPAKRTKLLSDNEASDSESGTLGGVPLDINSDDDASDEFKLKVNEEYSKRFEYNKKRDEKQRLEEKYKKSGSTFNGDDASDDDTTSEEEDDDGELATGDLDAEISATLNAIRSRDPRIFDPNTKFYRDFEAGATNGDGEMAKKEKPMHLRDYHRKNLLEGNIDAENEEEDSPPQTYAQEQEALKDSVVKSMHAAATEDEGNDGSIAGSDDFLIKKKRSAHDNIRVDRPTEAKKVAELDVATADKDPETYLSNFLAARAWVPGSSSRFRAFDSDDSDEEARADAFEEAYNMRFENPKHANEKLMSYGRDTNTKYSVRRDELSGRKKQREIERAKKESEKRQREEDKARLRRLKIDEVEEKVRKIKEAAGLRGQALDIGEWSKVLEEDWDDDRWEKEMKKRFGEDYYEQDEGGVGSDDDPAMSSKKKKKPKKPKWDDELDIKDLVPDFENDSTEKPAFTLSSDDEAAPGDEESDSTMDEDQATSQKPKTKQNRIKAREDAKRASRRERRKIEELVNNSLSVSLPPSGSGPTAFRYRETSPSSFGLTVKDILFADDAQLNQHVGLKKLAAFRDPEKKSRDKKKLGKKARLRQWRKDVFGNEEGPKDGFEEATVGGDAKGDAADGKMGGGGKKKRKKRKSGKTEVQV
ncbi:Kinetochore protein Spc24 [Elasticomyces elasticus]|nr:Kinetochore protein Spc24 [Elasticomyces elasticus]